MLKHNSSRFLMWRKESEKVKVKVLVVMFHKYVSHVVNSWNFLTSLTSHAILTCDYFCREVLKLGTLAQKIMLILMIRWRNEEIKIKY